MVQQLDDLPPQRLEGSMTQWLADKSRVPDNDDDEMTKDWSSELQR